MRVTVRLVLLLFLIALVLNSYNSSKLLSLAFQSLNRDVEQRTAFAANQISEELSNEAPPTVRIEDFLQSRMKTYGVEGAVLYGKDLRPEVKLISGLPPQIEKILDSPGQLLQGPQELRWDKYLLFPTQYRQIDQIRSMILIFGIEKLVQIQRSTKIVNYLNFVLMGFAALLGFYFIEASLRPFRLLLQTAKSVPQTVRSVSAQNEADLIINTFQRVIGQLKEKEVELERLHRSEKARADEVQQLNQDLIGSISSGLLLIDQSGVIRVFNFAAESILQIPRVDVLSHPYAEIMSPVSVDFMQDIDRCFREQIHINRAELEVKRPNGTRYLGASIMPLRDRVNQFAGVFCLFSDITEFKQLQQTMALKEKFASLGEMAAGVAHEFRNSLATISGYMQLLENKISQEQKAYIAPVYKEMELLQRVVKDFLSFAGPVQLQLTLVNLNDLIQECVEEVRVSRGTGSVVISTSGAFPEISGDEAMLRQVFGNLLRNAVESIDGAMRPGHVEVSGSPTDDGKYWVIDVRDNGRGINAENLARIFIPFFSTKKEGVGLGLAIVQKLLIQHNGTIQVESGQEGTLFRVQLPVA